MGLFLGALVAPSVVGLATNRQTRSIIAMAVVFGAAFILGGVGRFLGARSATALKRVRLGPVDSAFGVAVAVIATLFIAWFTAIVIENSNFTSLNAAIQQSRIVRAMDSLLPAPPAILARVKSFLASEGFPVVFAGLSPQASAPVTLPADAQVRAAVVTAGPSTLQVEGEGCGVIQEGSSFVVAPGLVVTNAHVVAGVHHVVVIDNGHGRDATPIWFDPELDVAVLRVPGLSEPALPVDTRTFGRGTSGVVLGYPGGGPFTYSPAGITNSFPATGLDIYGQNTTRREVYELQAEVRPGNSGGPLVASGDASGPANGTVIGLVFARSTSDPNVGLRPGPGPGDGRREPRRATELGGGHRELRRLSRRARMTPCRSRSRTTRSSGTRTPRRSSAPTARSTGCACRALTPRRVSPGSSATSGTAIWQMQPASDERLSRRRYRGDTLVLETEFETEGGVVRVVDCMPPARATRRSCGWSRASTAPSTCAWTSSCASTTARSSPGCAGSTGS